MKEDTVLVVVRRNGRLRTLKGTLDKISLEDDGRGVLKVTFKGTYKSRAFSIATGRWEAGRV